MGRKKLTKHYKLYVFTPKENPDSGYEYEDAQTVICAVNLQQAKEILAENLISALTNSRLFVKDFTHKIVPIEPGVVWHPYGSVGFPPETNNEGGA